jgi:hypothetical protein
MPLIVQSIETGSPLSADSSEFSDNCDEKEAPVPDDPETWRTWGRKKLGEAWYNDVKAREEAARITRKKEEERERINKEEVEERRKLFRTNRPEYYRQRKARNLELQRLAA